MRRAIACHPKDPVRRSIRLLFHDKIDQVVIAVDSGAASTQTKNFGMLNIPSRHVSQSPHSLVFMLNTAIASGFRSGYRGQSTPSLDTGFLVRGNNEIMVAQRFAIPDP
jgi:hypothetical protein